MFRNATARVAVLAAILIVQVGIIAFLYAPRGQTAGPGPLFPDLNPAEIERIVLYYDGDRLLLARAEGDAEGDSAWVLPEADNFPVIEANVTRLISDVVTLEADRLVATSPESHVRLRVDDANPIRKVELGLSNGLTETLYIGSSPNARATNVRRSGSDNVYLARDLNTSDVRMDAAGWVETAYLDVDLASVKAMTLTNANGTFNLVKDAAGAWTLDGLEQDERLLTTTVESLVSDAARLSMLRPLGREPRSEWGLDVPTATITLETVPVTDTAASDTGTITLEIGARDPDDDSLAVKASSSDWYVAVVGTALDPLLQANRSTLVEAAALPAQLPLTSPAASVPITGSEVVTTTSPPTVSTNVTP